MLVLAGIKGAIFAICSILLLLSSQKGQPLDSLLGKTLAFHLAMLCRFEGLEALKEAAGRL